jgi:hypothetical protein
MITNATTLKRKVEEKLRSLTPTTLRAVISDDFRTDPTQKDIDGYPVAIVSSPGIENETLDNRNNIRTYTFDITILAKADDTTAEDIEELAETIINAFDADPTLGNTADGGVEPSTGTPAPITDGSRNLIAIPLTVRARATRTIN